MNLNSEEKKVVVSALYQRIFEIDHLLSYFTIPDLVSDYSKEKECLVDVIKKML